MSQCTHVNILFYSCKLLGKGKVSFFFFPLFVSFPKPRNLKRLLLAHSPQRDWSENSVGKHQICRCEARRFVTPQLSQPGSHLQWGDGFDGRLIRGPGRSAFNLFLQSRYFCKQASENGLQLNCRESLKSEPSEGRITEEENEDDKPIAS